MGCDLLTLSVFSLSPTSLVEMRGDMYIFVIYMYIYIHIPYFAWRFGACVGRV